MLPFLKSLRLDVRGLRSEVRGLSSEAEADPAPLHKAGRGCASKTKFSDSEAWARKLPNRKSAKRRGDVNKIEFSDPGARVGKLFDAVVAGAKLGSPTLTPESENFQAAWPRKPNFLALMPGSEHCQAARPRKQN